MSNTVPRCSVCFSTESKTNDDIFVRCIRCKLGVHGSCYGCSFTRTSNPHDTWKCRYCHAISIGKAKNYENSKLKAIRCRICNQYKFGALKSCGKNQGFAHLVCAIWTPFTHIQSWYNKAPINGIEKCELYKSALQKLSCSICHQSHATIKCRVKHCRKFYHPLCLIETHRQCMIETDGNIDSSQTKIYYIYCPDHVQYHQVLHIYLLSYNTHC